MEIWRDGLTYKQVMERYNVAIGTVRQWVQKGWLVPTRFAGRVYFSPEALKRFETRQWTK